MRMTLRIFTLMAFGVSMLSLNCEGGNIRHHNRNLKTIILGPDYPTNEAFKEAFKETSNAFVYDEPCDECTKARKFSLKMPIADTTFNCDGTVFPLKKMCWGNCGQIYGKKGTRNITVIVPPSFNPNHPAPLMVDIEGTDYTEQGPYFDPEVLNNSKTFEKKTFDAIHMYEALLTKFAGKTDKKSYTLPNFVYVAVGLAGPGAMTAVPFLNPDFDPDNCGGGDGTARRIELRTVSDQYVNFIQNEVLPYVANEMKTHYPNFQFTDDPSGRVIAGQSDGGAASLQAVFKKPEWFGTSISYSPGMVFDNSTSLNHNQHPLEMADYWVPHPDGQGLIQNEPKETKGKGRYWISVNDWDAGTPGGADSKKCPDAFTGPATYGNFAVAGNNTAKLLAKNGHEVTLAYGLNACHTDAKIIHGHTPDAVRWAFAEWKGKN